MRFVLGLGVVLCCGCSLFLSEEGDSGSGDGNDSSSGSVDTSDAGDDPATGSVDTSDPGNDSATGAVDKEVCNEYRIALTGDDARYNPTSMPPSVQSDHRHLGLGKGYKSGVRFLIDVPADKSVVSAEATFWSTDDTTNPNGETAGSQVSIFSEQTTNPLSFVENANFDNRQLSPSSVAWDVAGIWQPLMEMQTPDLAPLFNALEDSSLLEVGLGKPVVLIFETDAGSAFRWVLSWDGDSMRTGTVDVRPKLEVCFR